MNPLTTSSKCIRVVAALVAVGTLVFAAGCGGGNDNGGGGGNPGGFSNASLKGQYAFTLRGVSSPDGSNSFFFVEGGVFTADGNGNITAGTDDFVEAQQGFSDQITGAYQINTDGSGDIQFNFPAGGASIYHITFSDVSHFSMEEADGFATSGGSGEKQDTSAFSAVSSGTFVYQARDLAAGSAKVGQIALNGGNITGTGDVLVGGVLVTPVTISGAAQAPDVTTGRGTVTITDDTGTNDYVYYIVSARKIRLFNIDALTSLSIGQAETQTGAPFSVASLNGTYVFGSAGDNLPVHRIHSVGLFAADGAGNVTSGSFDMEQDGTPLTGLSLASTPASAYSVDASSGRAAVTLNLSNATTNRKVMYLVSPSRAYFLVNDPVNVEDGTLDKQSGSFSNSTMKGQYSLFMDGFDANATFPYRDRVGTWFSPDGTGTVRTDYRASGFTPVFPPGGSVTDNSLSGTYSVDANGRTTANINTLSSNLIFYMVSANSGYLLQADNGVDIGGAITIQPPQ